MPDGSIIAVCCLSPPPPTPGNISYSTSLQVLALSLDLLLCLDARRALVVDLHKSKRRHSSSKSRGSKKH